MKVDLSLLADDSFILLNQEFSGRKEVIEALAGCLEAGGALNNKERFIEDIMAREALGATNFDRKLAIPHCQSAAVKRPALAAATLAKPVKDWPKEDSSNPDAQLVFMIAMPQEPQNFSHMQALAALMERLTDNDLIEALLHAPDAASFKELLSGKLAAEPAIKPDTAAKGDAPLILAVTACPAGIAHTYMAASYLEKAGAKAGLRVLTEKQGASGIEGRFSAQDLAEAKAVIFACDVAVKERERFEGLPFIETPVNRPLHKADVMIAAAKKLADTYDGGHRDRGGADFFAGQEESSVKPSFRLEAKKAILTGISYIVPLVVAGGMMLAVAVLVKEIFGLHALWDQTGSPLQLFRQLSGGMLGTLMTPVLAGYIAFSLAEKPALVPGFAAGLAANIIGAGFLGGLAGGFIAGYIVRYLKKKLKPSKHMAGFYSFFLQPVLSVLAVAAIMFFIVGRPVAWLNNSLVGFLDGMQGANAIVLGAIIGAMVSADLGGPINKAAYAFCLGALANGNFMPYAVFASVKMVSAFCSTLSVKLKPALFSPEERELGNSTWILGLGGITEGSIPIALNDPLTVLPAYMIGSAVAGGIVAFFGVGLQVPGAGIISMLVMEGDTFMQKLNAGFIWLGAALLGTLISTVFMLAFKSAKQKKAIKRQK